MLGCYDCGLPYGSDAWADFVIPDSAWLQISPTDQGGGVLCVSCMIKRAVAVGLEVKGSFTSGPFADHEWQKPK